MEKAVVDLLRPGHLAEAAGYWGGKPDELELLGQVENFVYRLRRGEEDYIVRLTHSSHRTPDQVRGELDWMDHLHRNGVNVARPIPSSNERFVEVIPAKGSRFIATAFERAKGEHASRTSEAWNERLFEEWGRTIGRMHAATKSYVPSDPAIKRDEWYQDDMLVNAIRYMPQETRVLTALGESAHWLSCLPQNRNCYGMVHTDVHQGNFFHHEGTITVFDFDDACYHWFAYDIAMPVYYTLLSIPVDEPEQQTEFMRTFFPPFMRGYSAEHQIEPFWIEQIPRFLQFRDQLLYVFCFKKFDMKNLNEREERFVHRLRTNFMSNNNYSHLDLSF